MLFQKIKIAAFLLCGLVAAHASEGLLKVALENPADGWEAWKSIHKKHYDSPVRIPSLTKGRTCRADVAF